MRNQRKDQLIKLYREVKHFFTKRTGSRHTRAVETGSAFSASYTLPFPYIQSLSSICSAILSFRQNENSAAAVHYKYNLF